jgi:hypothetical protein
MVSDGAEDDVGGVAGSTFEMAAPKVAIVLHVTDDGLDAEDAAFLTRDEDFVVAPAHRGRGIR